MGFRDPRGLQEADGGSRECFEQQRDTCSRDLLLGQIV